jgi:hypothetical protein
VFLALTLNSLALRSAAKTAQPSTILRLFPSGASMGETFQQQMSFDFSKAWATLNAEVGYGGFVPDRLYKYSQ